MKPAVKQAIIILVLLAGLAGLITAFYFISESIGVSTNMRYVGIAIGVLVLFIGGFIGFKQYRKRKLIGNS